MMQLAQNAGYHPTESESPAGSPQQPSENVEAVPGRTTTRSSRTTVSESGARTETLLMSLLNGMSNQSGQMSNALTQIGESLRELAQGQNQMLTMMRDHNSDEPMAPVAEIQQVAQQQVGAVEVPDWEEVPEVLDSE